MRNAIDEKQAELEIFKHYSGIRFLILPLFFTSMGAVALAYWNLLSPEYAYFNYLQTWVALGGLLLSIFFFVYELYLSKKLEEASNLLPSTLGNLRHIERFGIVTIVTLLLYGTPASFWGYIIFNALLAKCM